MTKLWLEYMVVVRKLRYLKNEENSLDIVRLNRDSRHERRS